MTNSKQITLAALAVVFGATLIASIVVSDAFARNSIRQHIDNDQRSTVVTAGFGSDIDDSGNNDAFNANVNLGGIVDLSEND
jgi:hypothetical protein